MALIQLGVTVVGIRGTIGGITFSSGQSGPYAKKWSRPGWRTTEAQSTQRSLFAAAGGLWAALDQSDRDDWDTFAAAPNETDYDPFGAVRYLSGWEWFSRAQLRRVRVGLGVPGDVPSGAAATAPANPALDVYVYGEDTSYVTWDSASFGATDSAVLALSVGRGVGIATMQRGFLMILAKYNPGDTGEDISDAIKAAFGDIVTGQRITGQLWKQAEAGNRSAVTVINTLVQ